MKKLIFVFGALLATKAAIAADQSIPVVKAPVPVFYNWSGLYVGLHTGYSWAQTDGYNQFFNSFTEERLRGWIGGGQVGVNHQIGRVVFGAELSGSYGDVKGNSNCFTSLAMFLTPQQAFTCQATENWSAQFLARLGYAPGDGRFLPYVLGGIAVTQLKPTKQAMFPGTPSFGFVGINTAPWGTPKVHEGVVLGAGSQYAVTPWLSIGIDYLFTVYGSQDHGSIAAFTELLNPGGVFSDVRPFTSPQNLTTHTARFVINYKLD